MAAKIRNHNPEYFSLEYDDAYKLNQAEKRMEERAIRERWPISPAKKAIIAARLIDLVENPAENSFNVIAAAKALISADKLNLEQQKIDMSQAEPDEIGDDFVMDVTADE